MSYLSEDPGTGVCITAGGVTRIALAGTEPAAVQRAADSFTTDLAKVVPGARAEVVDDPASAQLVVGTIGISPFIDEAIATGLLDVSQLLDGVDLVWEGFTIQTIGDQVWVAGTDQRGTMFGLYDLCEAAGVSPWWWFGDVPVRPRPHVTVLAGTVHTDWPAVKYRGIFINDEEELDNWARTHTGDSTIGPETYERIFDLVLRLKGNYVWPAMHVNAFNHDARNGQLADEMGIVIGASHCDMLLRSNEHEYAPWADGQAEPVAYDYSIPGRNREKLLDYWRGSVQQNGHFEVTWPVGMRGIHDSGFVTSTIDADASLTPPEKHRAKAELLSKVIRDQRSLLAEVLGERGRHAPQIFIPYKEVLPLYDDGLELPEDITIVWANDNFGYMRRFPTEAERARPGGHGLYYHSSYWSVPPRSYLATSSTPLALMRHELRKSWDHGIRTLWVNNVGGLKPLELETEYFLRYAWQVGKETTTTDVVGFVAQWMDTTFSGGHGRVAGEVYTRYYQLNNQRKIEHLDARAFSQTGYGDEASRRLAQLRELYHQTNAILGSLPEAERDAFLQLFAVKIHLAYLVNALFVYADRSTLAYRQGRFAAADAYLATSRVFDAQKRALLHSYNHVMSGGKWAGMLTPEQSPPPAMALFPAGTPALRIGAPGLGVAVWGEDDSTARALRFWPHGTSTKWIDLFTAGTSGLEFRVSADDWIEVSETWGTLDADRRIQVIIPDLPAAAGRSGVVTVHAAGQTVHIPVSVAELPALADDFTGSVEADGYVSLDASRPDAVHASAASWWATVDWLGRDLNPVMEARGGAGATLEYRAHLVTPGAHLLEVHRLPTLDSTGRIRVGVSVDGRPPVPLESPTSDEYRGAWTQSVLDNVERLRLRLPWLSPGEHVLRLHVLDEGFALSKLVIYTAELQPTNLGPRFSQHTRRPLRYEPDPDPAAVDLGVLDDVARRIYRVDPADVPLPAVVYAGPEYWHGPERDTARRARTMPQRALGARREWAHADGTKDVLAALAGGPVTEAAGVLAFEAENVLASSTAAWTTPSLDASSVDWTHTQAETHGRSGLAMQVDAPGRKWKEPAQAPGLHYAVEIGTAGRYRVWLLVKTNHRHDDSCWLAVDGNPQPLAEQCSHGRLFGWDTSQLWHWAVLSEATLDAGPHVLSILAREAGLRIDRIYLTQGDEVPPADADWVESARRARSEPEGDNGAARVSRLAVRRSA